MKDILDRLNAAIDGLCPCGAQPRDGSAYCSYDCEPTHRSVHSTAETDGTQMRWRPDLVTAQDDSDLELTGSGICVHSGHNTTIYRRRNTGTLHLRLDDGHRYVGMDVTDDEAARGLRPLWERLARELGNSRHLEPDTDPWADVMGYAREYRVAVGDWLNSHLGTATTSAQAGETVTVRLDNLVSACTPAPALAWYAADSNPLEDLRDFAERVTSGPWNLQPDVYPEWMLRRWPELQQRHESRIRRIACEEPDQPRHPMLAAIERRRNRNTGPQQRPRPPRQINPGRR